MLYRTLELDELVELKENDKSVVELMENNSAHLKLIALKKHQIIEPHMSHTDACVYVADGEIEFTFNFDDSCICQACECSMPDESDSKQKKYKIKKGQLFLFEKDVMHSVEAVKDSVFLLIKI